MTNNEFRKVRQRLGWTQAQLAESLGITAATVSKYESRRKVPRSIRLLLTEVCRKRGITF